ncbi:MAG TPA: ROK family protein [Alphaproteobacteria bacterium]
MAKPSPVKTRHDLYTLAIDVGGTGIKACILDGAGKMVVKPNRVATPHPCPPDAFFRAVLDMVESFPAFDRISIGFPGVVQHGRVITAPHLGTEWWRDYPLEQALSQHFDMPVRLLNDAEVQGLGVIAGHGLEVVLTLGTGLGSAVFTDGRLAPHLELGHHPIHGSKTYDEYIGDAARHACGAKKWNHRVLKAINIVHTLLNYDTLYLGGGNAAKLKGPLPEHTHVCSNDAGLTGGIHLWDAGVMADR